VPAARRVGTLSFAESLELACSGAKKPHPGTLGPASRAGVPIRILNSLGDHGPLGERHEGDVRDPDGAVGTLIGGRGRAVAGAAAIGAPTVKSLACRPNDRLLHVSRGPATAEAFAGRVVEAVERLRPALLVLRLDGEGADLALDRADRLAEAREALAGAGEVGVLHGRAVVSLVSEDLAADEALVARVLAAAGEYQPRLVVAGAAAPAVRCLVELEDLPAAAATLHRRLFEQ